MACVYRLRLCLREPRMTATISPIKQADLGLNLSTKKTRKREFMARRPVSCCGRHWLN
jgi:hypothetical protein